MYLIDSNVLIWALNGDRKLNARQMDILERPRDCLVSIASLWEISIKVSIGKLRAPADMPGVLRATGLDLLAITPEHTQMIARLPLHHRDPFDRMLIAQARCEGLSILTGDRHFADYGVTVV